MAKNPSQPKTLRHKAPRNPLDDVEEFAAMTGDAMSSLRHKIVDSAFAGDQCQCEAYVAQQISCGEHVRMLCHAWICC